MEFFFQVNGKIKVRSRQLGVLQDLQFMIVGGGRERT
jgi:hypothetical protein